MMSRERVNYLGMDGRGWYTRIWSQGVRRIRRTVRAKVFYR